MKANESEPPLTCRNELDDIKTRLATLAWDESGGSLSTAQTVSGMEVARARSAAPEWNRRRRAPLVWGVLADRPVVVLKPL